MKIVRVVPDREHVNKRLPRGFGVAWYRHDSHEVLLMPVPFNLIAGLVRRAWFACVRGVPDNWRRFHAAGYDDGYLMGYRAAARHSNDVAARARETGRAEGYQQALDDMLASIKVTDA